MCLQNLHKRAFPCGLCCAYHTRWAPTLHNDELHPVGNTLLHTFVYQCIFTISLMHKTRYAFYMHTLSNSVTILSVVWFWSAIVHFADVTARLLKKILMKMSLSRSLKLCYCYAEADCKHAQNLYTHLTALKRSGLIRAHACAFAPHGPRNPIIADHINTSHLILLLISAHFLQSEEFYTHDITSALERHKRGDAWVIPIFLKDVVLEGTYLSELRMLPNNNEFISRARDKDHAYAEVVREIRQRVGAMRDIWAIQAEQFQDEPPSMVTSLSDFSTSTAGLFFHHHGSTGPFQVPLFSQEEDEHLSASMHAESNEASSQAHALQSDIPLRVPWASSAQHPGFLCVSWPDQANWLAIGTTDGTLYLYNIQDYNNKHLLQVHTQDVYSVLWSNNLLASSSADGTVRIWNSSTESTIQILQGHTGTVNSVDWAPDGGQLVSGSADKTLRIWDARSGKTLRVLTGHTQSVMSVSWSPDSKLLASGSCDRTVRLWDLRSGRESRICQHQADIMSVAWSPDSKLLAIGVGNDVKLWEISTGRILSLPPGHTGIVTAVVWSPNGKLLASSSRDQMVCLWDPFLRKEMHTLQRHIKGVTGIAWSPDGKRLATVSHDELALWSVESGEQTAILDSQRILRTVIHQSERTLRVERQPLDDKDPEEFSQREVMSGEFLQHERTTQEHATLLKKQALICPYCHKPFLEKSVYNRRKRGLIEIVCDACQAPVSLLTIQQQSYNDITNTLAQVAPGESPQLHSQTILRHKIKSQAFDVFFCYNHQDRQVVESIGGQLKRHGILPWLEEWDLRPGDPWQRALEEQIRKAPTAIVFIGSHGMGPWQDSEMYAILRQMKKRCCRVIPVLLPGIPENSKLPSNFDGFLDEMHPIDFRVQNPDPMQWLLWGITGKK